MNAPPITAAPAADLAARYPTVLDTAVGPLRHRLRFVLGELIGASREDGVEHELDDVVELAPLSPRNEQTIVALQRAALEAEHANAAETWNARRTAIHDNPGLAPGR